MAVTTPQYGIHRRYCIIIAKPNARCERGVCSLERVATAETGQGYSIRNLLYLRTVNPGRVRTKRQMDISRRIHDPLGSRASSCYSGSDHDVEMHQRGPSDDDWDECDTFISFTTTETKCEQLFEEGLQLKTKGELDLALPCFLKCLEGMQECQYFAKLPQTLHVLAEIYQSQQCYDKAVEFASAEKLFYEAVLIDATQSQMTKTTRSGKSGEKKSKGKRKPFSKKPKDQSWRKGSNPAEYGDLMIKKADEYHHLAKLCADQKKYELALDYCGKSAKIRKSVFGDSHPVTSETLDYLAILYAEVGRVEYAVAFERMQRARQSKDGHVDERGDPSQVEETPSLTSESDNFPEEPLQFPPVKHPSAMVSSKDAPSSTMEPAVDSHASMSDSANTIEGPMVKEAVSTMEEEDAFDSKEPTPKGVKDEQRYTSSLEGWREAKQEAGSKESKHSLASGDCQKELPACENSLEEQDKEVDGIQEDHKSDLLDISMDISSTHVHVHVLGEHAPEAGLANGPLCSTCTQPPNKESTDEAVDQTANGPSTAMVTDVLGKAPAGVYVQVPEQGIQNAHCLPLWVLLLGAFVEMAIVAYVFVAHR